MIEFVKVKFYEDFKHDDLVIVGKEVCVGITTSYRSIEKDGINYPTNQNVTVIKVLHKNSKGIFYKERLSKGYGSSIERVYLDINQIEILNKYLEENDK